VALVSGGVGNMLPQEIFENLDVNIPILVKFIVLLLYIDLRGSIESFHFSRFR